MGKNITQLKTVAGSTFEQSCTLEEALRLVKTANSPKININIAVSLSETPSPLPKRGDAQAFTYAKYDTHQDNLANLWDGLRLHCFIAPDTKLSVFKRIFSSQPVKTKVVWTGNISELAYFIKLLHNEKKYVANLKQKQWEVTCQCFEQADGQPFDRSKLGKKRKPTATGDLLERLVDHLKW